MLSSRHQRPLRRRARRAFDARRLVHCCTADDFSRYGTVTDLGHGDYYVHRDAGADILGVAHLDTVAGTKWCRFIDCGTDTIVRSPGLDDRLGVYVVTHLLPALGVKCDWLLTTGEEQGRSTAGEFFTDKQYNWLFSFDRTGTDVVMYEYDNPTTREMVRSVGAPIGCGSFSDICFLEHLGCAGFNWGVGYHDYHSTRAYASLNDVFLQVGRFLAFYQQYKDEHVPHSARSRWWGSWDQDADEECPVCDRMTFSEGVCLRCGYEEWEGGCRASTRWHDLTESEWTRMSKVLDAMNEEKEEAAS